MSRPQSTGALLRRSLLLLVAGGCVTTFAPSFGTTVTITVVGNGRIVSDPAGIDCPGDCSEAFTSVDTVLLQASGGDGVRVGDWDTAECPRGAPSCKTIGGDLTVVFEYRVQVVPSSAVPRIVSSNAGIGCTSSEPTCTGWLPHGAASGLVTSSGAFVRWDDECPGFGTGCDFTAVGPVALDVVPVDPSKALWVTRIHGSSTDWGDLIAVHGDQVVTSGFYVGLATAGTISFPNASARNAFLLVSDLRTGEERWWAAITSNADDTGQGVEHRAGSIHWTGQIPRVAATTLHTPTGPLPLTAAGPGGSRVFWVTLSTSGESLLRGAGVEDEAGLAISGDDDGNRVIAGAESPGVSENGFVRYVTAAGSGSELLLAATGSTESAFHDVAFDLSRFVAVAVGYFNGQVALMEGTGASSTINATALDDGMIAAVGTSGALAWHLETQGNGFEEVSGIALEPDGTSWVTGFHTAGLSLGGVSLGPPQGADPFAARIDPSSNVLALFALDTSAADVKPLDIDIAPGGDLIVCGQFSGALGSPAVISADSAIWVARFAPTGERRWMRVFLQTGGAQANGCAADADGGVLVTGYYAGTTDFGTGALSNEGDDGFVLRLAP